MGLLFTLHMPFSAQGKYKDFHRKELLWVKCGRAISDIHKCLTVMTILPKSQLHYYLDEIQIDGLV